MEYPYLKKALDAAGFTHIKLGVDQQMRDFGQASTAIQAFADVLSEADRIKNLRRFLTVILQR